MQDTDPRRSVIYEAGLSVKRYYTQRALVQYKRCSRESQEAGNFGTGREMGRDGTGHWKYQYPSVSRFFPPVPVLFGLLSLLAQFMALFHIFKGPTSRNQLISEAGGKIMKNNSRKSTKMGPNAKTWWWFEGTGNRTGREGIRCERDGTGNDRTCGNTSAQYTRISCKHTQLQGTARTKWFQRILECVSGNLLRRSITSEKWLEFSFLL
jgi:hypothetical protein